MPVPRVPAETGVPHVTIDAGTAGWNQGDATPVPATVARGTAQIPGSTPDGTAVTSGTGIGSSPRGTSPTSSSSTVTTHRDRWFLRRIGRGTIETTGTGTEGTSSSSSSTDMTKGAKHSSGETKQPRFLRSPDFWLWVVILAISVVAALMSMDGTMRGWTWAGLDPTNPLRYGMPFIAEFSFLMWLMIAEVAIRAERSPFLWWFAAAVTAGLVVLLNTAFGQDRPHPYREAVIFGVASAMSLAGMFAKFYLRYVKSEVLKGLRAGAKPKVLLTPRLIEQPRLRWRAHLIAGRVGCKTIIGDDDQPQIVPLTVADVISLADLWRDVYEDYMADSGDRKLAKRTAWNAVKVETGAKVYKPKKLEVGRVEFVRPQRTLEVIDDPDIAVEAFKRELAEKPTQPKPSAAETPRRERPPADDAEPVVVSEQWFKDHANRISLVQSVLDGWPNIAAPPNVDFVQALAKDPRCAGAGLGNRAKATQVTKCIKALWQQAQADVQASK